MKVLLVHPVSYEAEIMNITNNVETLQQLVGGYFEPIYKGEFIILCDEEGNLKGLPSNILGLVGRVVFVRNGEEDFESLTDDDIKQIMKDYNLK